MIVGDAPAAPVTRRARIGAGARRTDQHLARRGDRDDAAAPGADARDLGRQRVDDQVVLERERVVDERPAILNQGDVGGSPADVATNQVGLADRLAQPGAGRRSRRRSGDHDPKRLRERVAPRYERGRAVGEVELAREPKCPQLLIELARVAAEHQLHHHVDHRRRRARVLLGQRRGFRRDRDRHIAEDLERQLAQALLVTAVDVGVQQADGHALHVTALEDRQLPPGVVLVELGHHAAVGEDPLSDAPAQVARDQRPAPNRRTAGASSRRSARRAVATTAP